MFKFTPASYLLDMTRRALLSVFDKSGVVEFARALVELGWDVVSSGGTAMLEITSQASTRPTASLVARI